MTGFHHTPNTKKRKDKHPRQYLFVAIHRLMEWRDDIDVSIMVRRLLNRIRRSYLFTFRKRYVIESLKRRRGSCKINCGSCCENGRCSHLTRTKTCKIYDIRICNRPFPIDEKDKRMFEVDKVCGYWWKND